MQTSNKLLGLPLQARPSRLGSPAACRVQHMLAIELPQSVPEPLILGANQNKPPCHEHPPSAPTPPSPAPLPACPADLTLISRTSPVVWRDNVVIGTMRKIVGGWPYLLMLNAAGELAMCARCSGNMHMRTKWQHGHAH